ncbi:MAG: GSCFA domain-containing protein [Geobacteraceae bacterium]|nr:GSCFA domain-containing protein [Geobacteraceae bacterium]
MIEFSADVALVNYKKPLADWSVARRRMRSGRVIPHFTQTFSLKKSDTILTLGSCFAREIETHLSSCGCNVPALDLSGPDSEINGQELNKVIGLFTPPTFQQAIEWAKRIWERDKTVQPSDCDCFFFDTGNGAIVDLGLAQPAKNSYQQCFARRQQLYKLYEHAFTAKCVMITPGLVETWFDNKEKLYTVTAPLRSGQIFDADRFSFRVLEYTECLESLLATVDLIREINPDVKLLITVSPVPLRYTFSDRDILVANVFSKCVLRTACDELIRKRPHIDYFPSYEAVTLSTRKVWLKDKRHVDRSMVGEIVSRVIQQYFKPTDTIVDELEHYKLNFGERILYAIKKLAKVN